MLLLSYQLKVGRPCQQTRVRSCHQDMGCKLAVKERLGGDVQLGPKAFATVIKADAEKWGKVVKEAGIKTE